ncbi:ABC transporter permease [Spiroplasma alleghenense]|uniref:ABC transporter permease n=1 Tax=Spiroplasma alleghenense TaxID=216931 RepID=A0A345Z474_9MOLU|nr:ABC transporter permease [Spiroplasma alleghenense]AXK51403.1 ABC transporter permease [Spiroplasma alleghenense]
MAVQTQLEKERPTKVEAETNLTKPKIKISGWAFTNIIFAKLFKQKSTFVLLIVSVAISVAFSILFLTAKNNAQILSYFDYFFVVFMSFIIFVSIMKITQTLWKTQFEDKSIVIYQAQSISRTKLFFAMFLSSLYLIIIIILINLATMLIIFMAFHFKLNVVFLRFWVTLLIYSLIAAFCLVSFCTFINLIFSQAFTLILFTFILAATFICSLPYQFYRQSLDGISIRFTDTTGKWQYQPDTVWKAKEVENRLNFQTYVEAGQIKYPHLSKWINDYFVSGEYIQGSWERGSSDCVVDINKPGKQNCALNERQALWRDLGLLKTTESSADLNNVLLQNAPTSDPVWDKTYPTKGSRASFHFVFKNFISRNEIDSLITKYENSGSEADKVKLDVVKDFANYYDDLIAFFTAQVNAKDTPIPQGLKLELGEYRMFYANSSKFGPLLDFNAADSWVQAGTDGEHLPVTQDHFNGIVRSYVESSQTLRPSATESTTTTAMANFMLKAYEPTYLAARILEYYFISQTSDFTYITNLTIVNDSSWENYNKKTDFNRLVSNFNFLEKFLQFYTSNRGFAYGDFWFNPESNSSISFEDQKNLFLSYDDPRIFAKEVDGNTNALNVKFDKWKNYKSNSWMFVATDSVLCLMLLIISSVVFKRMDIN